MSVSMIVLIIIVLLVVLLVIWGIGIYNGLVNLRNRVANGWAQIDVQLKQRADLVPNLVQTVKGYASHESTVLEEVTKARADVAQAQAQTAGGDQMQARADAEQRLGQSLVNLMARAEAYPELKANQNFLDLQRQLKDLEDKIAYARQFYNDVVQKFNTRIETVPSNIIASLFHFRQAQYFQADEGSRQAPVVDFGQ
ncbi:LemA family protein [Bifidobacterium asteroides]|uniref:LemA family protein n=1 Tax=Bifidobacterium asteroides TaxID=1684 RepID=A0A2N3R9J3_9BIFI|nr:LemA family protein [Bifidobacterium asteroides]PKV09026.1 LemA family protein [Bifidobacterium asteroides]